MIKQQNQKTLKGRKKALHETEEKWRVFVRFA